MGDPCCGQNFNPSVSNLNFWLTEQCPFQCVYCYEKGRNMVRSATWEIVKGVIDWLVQPNVSTGSTHHINFFGGEPLLKIDLIEKALLYSFTIQRKHGRKINFGVTTNGYLFTDEILDLFKTFNCSILLSLDGDIETQGKYRGAGSEESRMRMAETVFSNARKIAEMFPNTTVRMTVVPESIKDIRRNIEFILGLGFKHISPHFVNDGYTPLSTSDVAVYQKVMEEEVFPFLVDYFWKTGEVPIATISKLFTRKEMHSPCGAGKGFLGVSVDGGIYPCHRFVYWDEWKLGDFTSPKLDWGKREFFFRFDNRRDIQKCKDCGMLHCGFRCFASNYARYGSLTEVSSEECQIYAIDYNISQRLKNELSRSPSFIQKFLVPKKDVTPQYLRGKR